jgi:hypothetical protein
MQRWHSNVNDRLRADDPNVNLRGDRALLTNFLQAIDARVIARLHGCHFAAVSSQFHKGDSQ